MTIAITLLIILASAFTVCAQYLLRSGVLYGGMENELVVVGHENSWGQGFLNM